MRDEATLRPPPVCQRWTAVAGPVPIGTSVERIGQPAYLGFVRRVPVEVRRDRQCAREQKSRINRGKLALPDTSARFDVQEVIEETLVAREVRLRALRAFEQVTQP